MFETLTSGFDTAIQHFRGRTVITPETLEPALSAIRKSLLEADVAYEVTESFLDRVEKKALDAKLRFKKKSSSKKPQSVRDYFTAVCYEEISNTLGEKPYELTLEGDPSIIMMVGLQGVGKTTTCGKLAQYLLNEGKKPLLVACDVYRPAAIEQLHVIGTDLNVPVHSEKDATPLEICKKAIEEAKRLRCDVVVLDTAGRLTLDEEMMQEVSEIKTQISPHHTFLVIDAMMGQDAVQTAQSFQSAVLMDAMIMTKLDGDARGGAALSASQITEKPIAFIGTGEHPKDFELFRPDGLSSRILGMGDLHGLIAEFKQQIEGKGEEEQLQQKILSGRFTFEDMLKQLNILKKFGSFKRLISKLPLNIAEVLSKNPESEIIATRSIILSMTADERSCQVAIDPSRARRIAKGSGRNVVMVQTLTQRLKQTQAMMYQQLKKIPQKEDLSQGMVGMPSFETPGGEGQNPPAQKEALLAEKSKEKKALQDKRQKRKLVQNRRKAARRSRRKGR